MRHGIGAAESVNPAIADGTILGCFKSSKGVCSAKMPTGQSWGVCNAPRLAARLNLLQNRTLLLEGQSFRGIANVVVIYSKLWM